MPPADVASTSSVETVEAPNAAPAPVSTPPQEATSVPAPESSIDLGKGLDGEVTQNNGESKPAENEWLGVPKDNYTLDGIDLPEDQQLDESTMNELANVCSDMGLSQKAFANIVQRMTPFLAQRQDEQIEAFRQDNLKTLYQDKELGGARYKQTLNDANRIYQKYVSPDLQELFSSTGLNTHPEVVRLFHSLSKALSDDAIVRGGQAQKPTLANFFNNSNMR